MGLLIGMVAALVVMQSTAAEAEDVGVNEVGTSFNPSQVDITVGDRVVWTNRSNTSHTVTFQNGPDLHRTCTQGPIIGTTGDCQEPGATAQHTFTAAGTFPYFCKLHRAQGMAGVVVVSPAATTSTTTAGSSTTATTRGATTSTTRATSNSSTTATTRQLATSSTLASSSTTSTTTDSSSALLPGDPPPFAGDDVNAAAGRPGGSNGSDSTTVALIVALLLAVAAGGGYLLWRLRPGRA